MKFYRVNKLRPTLWLQLKANENYLKPEFSQFDCLLVCCCSWRRNPPEKYKIFWWIGDVWSSLHSNLNSLNCVPSGWLLCLWYENIISSYFLVNILKDDIVNRMINIVRKGTCLWKPWLLMSKESWN